MKLYELEKVLDSMRDNGANNLTEVIVRIPGQNLFINSISCVHSNVDFNKYDDESTITIHCVE